MSSSILPTFLVSSPPTRNPAIRRATPSLGLTAPTRRNITMDAQELNAYLADAPPSVVRLEIAKHFDALTDQQKRYAHYISK